MNKDSRILVGKVSGCFGVKGWLKIFSYCDPRENIASYESWLLGDKLYDSIEVKKQGKLIIAKLKGIDDKDTAMTFLGQKIEIYASQLQKLNNQQFYWRDLIGLKVSNTHGIEFGKIASMLETGSNDVIVIKGKRERLVPFIMNKTVVEVDLDAKTMVVDWHEDD
ncbi:MAG TPA: ribosome maturation factor RimM [Oceanospirillales bacterium]|nr:ribosome maturation factor RimM [Oceanospirillales bacterium]